MIESILGPLIVYGGQKLIDRVLDRSDKSPAIAAGKDGELKSPEVINGRLRFHGGDFLSRAEISTSTLLVEFYSRDDTEHLLYQCDIILLVVVDEYDLDPIIISVDPGTDISIDLTEGVYSVYAFAIDLTELNIEDSEIIGFGLPLVEDPSGRPYVSDGSFYIPDSSVLQIRVGIEPAIEYPWVPERIGDLLGAFGEPSYDSGIASVQGKWLLVTEYEFGTSQGEVYLAQKEDLVYGVVLEHDLTDEGDQYISQQQISGRIDNSSIVLLGDSVRVIRGPSTAYNLDSWSGVVTDRYTIQGVTKDTAGVEGQFLMKRV